MNGRWKTMKEYDSLSDNEKCNMLASVANLYYNAEITQNQIAERFFTSRSKISRMKQYDGSSEIACSCSILSR